MSTTLPEVSRSLAQTLTIIPAAQRHTLAEHVCHGFALPLHGIHGPTHWLRVRENGLRLAEATGADPVVVELFAVFHDARRENDSWDPEHGPRAADLIRGLREPLAFLGQPALERLLFACAHHTQGWTEADLTVQACWDADRLDLGRVGIRPIPERLCTTAAREPELLAWAYDRSRIGLYPR